MSRTEPEQQTGQQTEAVVTSEEPPQSNRAQPFSEAFKAFIAQGWEPYPADKPEPLPATAWTPHVERGEVTRADVAAVLAAVLDEPGTIGQQWELVGGEVPVAEAVRQG